jgi:hypothetical protein
MRVDQRFSDGESTPLLGGQQTETDQDPRCRIRPDCQGIVWSRAWDQRSRHIALVNRLSSLVR